MKTSLDLNWVHTITSHITFVTGTYYLILFCLYSIIRLKRIYFATLKWSGISLVMLMGLFGTFLFCFATRTHGKIIKRCVAVVFTLNFILLSVFITFFVIALNNKLPSSKLYWMLMNSFSYNLSSGQ